MRTKPETILLARVRRLLREAARWYKMDNGMPKFWKTENYKTTIKAPRNKEGYIQGDFPYYTRSSKAIEEIAKKIVEEVRKNEK